MEGKIIGGNYYDKHNSKNPLIRILMNKFYITLLECIHSQKAKTILDVGCGEGHLTKRINNSFKNKKVKITALEYDQETVDEAKGHYPNLDIRQGDILNLNGKYDLLIATEVLEHIKEYDKALRNCKKVSNTCIFSVPNEPFFRMGNMFRLRYLKSFGNTPGHVNNWTRKGFEKLLKKHFENVEIKTTSFWNFAICNNPKN